MFNTSNRSFTNVRVQILVFLLLVILQTTVIAEEKSQKTKVKLQTGLSAVQFDISPPLKDITPLPITRSSDRGGLIKDDDGFPLGEKPVNGPQDIDILIQERKGQQQIPSPLASFNGPSNIAGVAPPDSVGDIGPNHYVAMSNLFFQIYDRSGVSLFGPAATNTLWSGFGGACEAQNAGDPIILYDQIADRWLLTQFTSSGSELFNCVALSTSPDPTGTYFRWAFSNGANFPDYPKYGVGADAYYISTRDFLSGSYVGIGAYALNRAEMIAGNPSPGVIKFTVDRTVPANVGDGLLPMDIDGFTLPPNGNPHYFLGTMDNGGPYSAPQDALTLWAFDANFADPPSSSFTLANTINIGAYDTIFPCGGGRSCIPQPDTTNQLDIQSYRQRPLHRFAYRNFGTHESLVANQSVEASPGIAGIRWWEIRSPNNNPVVFQEGTYGPGVTDGIHRWMGSVAMDSAGNIGLGYSASSSTVFPSLYYTGRLSSDPLGTLPQGEGVIFNGTGSQTGGGSRWGDYSSINVDPLDDCTFWYVSEYIPVTSERDWQLRIGSFRFNECGTPGITLSLASEASQSICVADDASYSLNVGSIAGFNSPVTLAANGNPSPSTALFSPTIVNILPGSSTLNISNTTTLSAGIYPMSVDATAIGADTRSVNLELIVFDTVPNQPALNSPTDAALNVEVLPAFSWTGSGAETHTIEVSTDTNFNNIVFTQTVNTTTVAPATPLDSNTQYYWRVISNNTCGDSLISPIFTFTTIPAPGDCVAGTSPVIVQSYDFESGAQGWISGSNQGTDTWTLSTANPTPGSSTQHWHVDDQSSTSDTFLTSPTISLPVDKSPLSFQFNNYQEMEDNNGTACWDGGILEISVNAGAFTQVDNSLLGTDPYDGAFSGGPLSGAQGWCGDPQAYLNSIVDINAQAGDDVQFRFRVSTDGSVGRPGWDIDDILIQGCELTNNPAITVTKTATLTIDTLIIGEADLNDVITFNVSVENTGNVDLDTLEVNDAMGGGALTCTPTSLTPAAVATCTAYTYTVQQSDIDTGGTIDNTATATMTDPSDASTYMHSATTHTTINQAFFKDGFE